MYPNNDKTVVPTEDQIKSELEAHLEKLNDIGRCDWRKEVRMLCWIQASRSTPSTLRIDYVAKIDGVLVGFEAKKPPERAADLGKDLVQCAQYAHGVIAAATIDRVHPEWVGQSLLGVFLVSDARYCSDYVQQHGVHAHRLFGPANVGFWSRRFDCFELHLCADRVWSKDWGWNRGIIGRNHRIGSGVVKSADFSGITIPDGANCPFIISDDED